MLWKGGAREEAKRGGVSMLRDGARWRPADGPSSLCGRQACGRSRCHGSSSQRLARCPCAPPPRCAPSKAAPDKQAAAVCPQSSGCARSARRRRAAAVAVAHLGLAVVALDVSQVGNHRLRIANIGKVCLVHRLLCARHRLLLSSVGSRLPVGDVRQALGRALRSREQAERAQAADSVRGAGTACRQGCWRRGAAFARRRRVRASGRDAPPCQRRPPGHRPCLSCPREPPARGSTRPDRHR